ncbi:mucin-2-like [Euwallacea fornicatus]|uniref:mucin-2-like n=1 Tax=Euwallacea fornicatus TaxID=995702 RepID=UPI0033903AB2
MKNFSRLLLVLGAALCVFHGVDASLKKECGGNKGLSTSKLVCYYSTVDVIDGCYCTHVILPANADVKVVEKLKKKANGVKVYVTVSEFNQGLIDLLKSTKIDGLELSLRKLDSKNDITDFISTIKTKIGAHLEIALAVPPKAELVAKYFDFKPLSKHVDLFILQTAFLGASTNVTFHPSRLSGMWDMQNTDSVVDLASGLGAPLSKLVITAPVQAFQFTLQNEEYTAPGSPALDLKSITRNELCHLMEWGNWTLESDEDQAGQYIFSNDQWVAFDDSKSIDIKAKYTRVRGLAGIALKDLSQDGGSECGTTILQAVFNGLSRQARAPRQAILHSLEREIVDSSSKSLDSVQVSPFRISRVIDTEGKIHVVRQDSRTEFECSRQGYFVHPRSCNRFYRCVKFDQLTDDYNVFEFDCPAGLAFDERVEVCVWPGSLPHGTPCSGSSEIAPVPKERFVCPSEPGYYPDPENCRWFFACLDHGKSGLTPYEFRCPFGLVFDGERLICEWSWLVPKCASGAGLDIYYYGGANKGSSGLILQNYDGLGGLGSIKLGGIAGSINKPISTIYSNVGIPLRPAYQNSGSYIEGSRLSYNAAQSLQNAGLLKINNGVVSQITPSSIKYEGVDGYQGSLAGVASSTANYEGQYQSGELQRNNGYFYGGSSKNVDGVGSGVAGSVNIVGGGYSAVGTLSGVDVSHNGEGDIVSSTPSVLTVTETPVARLTPIPTVTAVPVPGIKTVAGFDTFRGGVIANTPELQYKVKTLEDAGLSNNISTSYVNFVVTSPHRGHPYSQNEGYIYNNQRKGLAEGLNTVSVTTETPFVSVTTGNPEVYVSSTAQPVSIQQEGYVNPKPGLIAVHETPSIIYSTPRPQGYLLQDIDDHKYSIQPQIVVASTPATPSLSTINYRQLNNFKHPSVTVVKPQIYQQPQLVAVYQKQPVEAPYTYQSVAQQAVGITYEQPQIYQQSIQPAISYINLANKADSDSSNYQNGISVKPNVKLEETPVVYSTSKPVVYTYQKPTVEVYSTPRPAVVSSYFNLANTKFTAENVMQQQDIDYGYPRPLIKFEETPILPYSSSKPAVVVENYSYSKPSVQEAETTYSTSKSLVVQPAQKAIVSSYFNITNAKNTAENAMHQQNIGYSYPKPSIQFSKIPVVTYQSPKPAVVVENYSYSKPSVQVVETTYSTPKPLVVQPTQEAIVSSYFNIANAKTTVANAVHQKNVGYSYPKPSISFQETPVVTHSPLKPAIVVENYSYSKPSVKVVETTYSTPKSVVVQPAQQAIVSNYFNTASAKDTLDNVVLQQNAGYSYPQPIIKFEEAPVLTYSTRRPVVEVSTAKPIVVQRGYSYQKPAVQFIQAFNLATTKATSENVVHQENVDYSYLRPQVKFEETPIVTYSTSKPVIEVSTVKPVVFQQGYSYQKPAAQFVETPVTYSTPKTLVVQSAKPGVVSSYFNLSTAKAASHDVVQQQSGGYSYPKPEIKFEESPVANYFTPKPIIQVSTPKPVIVQEGYTYQKPAIQLIETPVTYSTAKPYVIQSTNPAVVSSYFNLASPKLTSNNVVQHEEYNQPQFSTKFEEKLTVINSTPKPFVKAKAIVVQEDYSYQKPSVQFIETYSTTKPAVVSSYFNLATSQAAADSEVQQQESYSYPKPSVQFEETPVVTYESTSKPIIEVSTYKPPVVIQDYSYQSTPRPFAVQQSVGYSYPKPSVKFEETPQAVVTSYFNFGTSKVNSQENYNRYSYTTSKPVNPFLELKETPGFYSTQIPDYVVTTTVKPSVVSYLPPSTQKPAVVSEYNYVDSTTSKPVAEHRPVQSSVVTSYFNLGSIAQEPLIPSPAVIEKKKPAMVNDHFQRQPSRSYSYPKPAVQLKQEPVQEVSFVKKNAYVTGDYQQNLQENYNYEQNYKHFGTVVVEDYQIPDYEKVRLDQIQYYQPKLVVSTTPKPNFVSTIKSIATKKLEPVTPATVTFYDSRYTSTPTEEFIKVKSTTLEPTREYLPVTPTVKVTTTLLPKVVKVVENFVAPEVTTLARDYLPVQVRTKASRVEVVTPSSEYLPRRKGTTSTLAPEITTLIREYLPVRARVKTTSTTEEPSYKPQSIKIVRPVTVIKTNDAHPLLSAKLGAQCTCVSNKLTLRRKQKVIVVEDTENDEDYDVERENKLMERYEPLRVVDIVPTTLRPQTRKVKVYPITSVNELFYQRTTTEDSTVSDREIVKAVRTGLKLVKEAAKDGAKEGTQEVLARQYDRFGSGGVRSRTETLQGTIDCQRAGLFRHPTQCNKFYSCRWDCKKNRFTLHVFNCPVHLTFDNTLGACNWPSQGPACVENTLITSD